MTLFTNRNWNEVAPTRAKITNELFIPHLLTKELILKGSGKKYCWKLHCREKRPTECVHLAHPVVKNDITKEDITQQLRSQGFFFKSEKKPWERG